MYTVAEKIISLTSGPRPYAPFTGELVYIYIYIYIYRERE